MSILTYEFGEDTIQPLSVQPRPDSAPGCGIPAPASPPLRLQSPWLRATWAPSFDEVTSLWIYTKEPPTPAVQGGKLGMPMLGESPPPARALAVVSVLFGRCPELTPWALWALLKGRLGTVFSGRGKMA